MRVNKVETKFSGELKSRVALYLQKLSTGRTKRKVEEVNMQRLQNCEVLLNFISHDYVAWTFVKLSSLYKYVGIFV